MISALRFGSSIHRLKRDKMNGRNSVRLRRYKIGPQNQVNPGKDGSFSASASNSLRKERSSMPDFSRRVISDSNSRGVIAGRLSNRLCLSSRFGFATDSNRFLAPSGDSLRMNDDFDPLFDLCLNLPQRDAH